jgi:hypothetical protein
MTMENFFKIPKLAGGELPQPKGGKTDVCE